MQTAPAQLAAQLARGGVRALYVVMGDEPLQQQEAADAIRAAARAAGATERSVHVAAGAHFDWSAVLAAGSARSLFAERQLVEIRIPGGKPGKDGAAVLQRLAAAAGRDDAQGTVTLVLLPRLDGTTRKGAWFTALEQHGVVVAVEPVERAQLPQWIAARLKRQHQQVAAGEAGQHALQRFADRVEGNLLAAHQEIEKLALLFPGTAEAPRVLAAADIEGAVAEVARYDVFRLSEAVLAGQVARVARMLDGLRAAGEAEVLVHYTLAEDIRGLKRVRDALDAGQPLPVALRAEPRLWGPRGRLFERVAPRLDGRLLTRLLQAAHLVDGIVKGLPQPDWPRDAWQALHRLAQGLTRACAAAATAR